MNVTLKDFYPINQWKVDVEGEHYDHGHGGKTHPKFIIDLTTNRRYLNESESVIAVKCFLLSWGTPFIHPVASICNIAYRILKLISGYHFLVTKEEGYEFKDRLVEAGKDFLRIPATPLALVALEAVSIYGWEKSYDARKLYATIERALYGESVLAPCFRPDPTAHALGGNMNRRNAF